MKPFHILLLFLVVAVWGINFVFVKMALDSLPPIFLCFIRFFLLSIPAVFFFQRPTTPFKMVVAYSLLMFALQFTLIFLGIQQGVSAGLASLLLQTQVFFSLFFGAFLLKEPVQRRQLFGALLAFLGILIVYFKRGGSATAGGLFLVLASAVVWGFGSVLVKKMGKIQTASLLTWGGLLAWPPLLFLSLYFEKSQPLLLELHHLPWKAHAGILFITFGATGFGFGVWNFLVQIYPLGTIAPFTLLVPVFGMLASALFLGEALEWWKVASAVLVVSGLSCIVLRPKEIKKISS